MGTLGIEKSSQDYVPNLISVLCPTRGRAKQLETMLESCLAMANNPKLIEFCFYIDRDDLSYDFGQINRIARKVKIMRGPKMSLSSMFNSLLAIAEGEFLFWSGDDVIFKTRNWDLELKSPLIELTDHLGVTHANDMATYDQIYASIGMVHYEWVKLFGYIFTPHLKDNGIDPWISEVASSSQRLYFCPTVLIEHLQYRQGKAALDSVYKNRLEEHKTYDLVNLYHSLKSERRRDSLILSQKTGSKIVQNKSFLISSQILKFCSLLNKEFSSSSRYIYIGSMTNWGIIKKFLKKILFLKNNSSW